MKKILFVCFENSARSQMAEAFARLLGKDVVNAYSAGSNPTGRIKQEAIDVMAEEGIDISSQRSKGFKDLPVSDFDVVVSMGCGDMCPFFPAGRHLNWKIDDPGGKRIETFRTVRDVIKEKIKKLMDVIKSRRNDF